MYGDATQTSHTSWTGLLAWKEKRRERDARDSFFPLSLSEKKQRNRDPAMSTSCFKLTGLGRWGFLTYLVAASFFFFKKKNKKQKQKTTEVIIIMINDQHLLPVLPSGIFSQKDVWSCDNWTALRCVALSLSHRHEGLTRMCIKAEWLDSLEEAALAT